MGKKTILFIASHRKNRSPSQRFRFEQYLDYLSQNGFQCDFSYIISEKDDSIFYAKGNYFKKFIIIIKAFLKRCKDVLHASSYDIIFIQREAFVTGSVFFEKLFSYLKPKLVFDFDDAIWLLDISQANENLRWLKKPEKTSKIISLSDLVFAGNKYLADYAIRFHNNVKVLPTTIDTDEYISANLIKNSHMICIGWSGSITTIKHFGYAIPFLRKVKEKYGNKVYFKVMGDEDYYNEELDIKGIPWSADRELKELSSFDIGIMPLPNDEWAKGKCGLKGLSYMALEIPTIMSPIGVNTEIITDGVNGFLADHIDEWVEKLSKLIESRELREQLGKEARKTVVEKYSVQAQKDNYLKYIQQLLEQ